LNSFGTFDLQFEGYRDAGGDRLAARSGPARHRPQKSGPVYAPAEQVLKEIGMDFLDLADRRRFEESTERFDLLPSSP
jgi:hypothetical protein